MERSPLYNLRHDTRVSQRTLIRWARSMKYFRICGGFGGHWDNGDSIEVGIRGIPLDEMLEKFRAAGLTVEDPNASERSRHLKVGGIEVYAAPGREVGCGFAMAEGRLQGWVLNKEMIDAAARFEAFLEPYADRIVDPPLQCSGHCLAPCFYPDVFAPEFDDARAPEGD